MIAQLKGPLILVSFFHLDLFDSFFIFDQVELPDFRSLLTVIWWCNYIKLYVLMRHKSSMSSFSCHHLFTFNAEDTGGPAASSARKAETPVAAAEQENSNL